MKCISQGCGDREVTIAPLKSSRTSGNNKGTLQYSSKSTGNLPFDFKRHWTEPCKTILGHVEVINYLFLPYCSNKITKMVGAYIFIVLCLHSGWHTVGLGGNLPDDLCLTVVVWHALL